MTRSGSSATTMTRTGYFFRPISPMNPEPLVAVDQGAVGHRQERREDAVLPDRLT
jgi:hypothetical protein